MDHIYHEPQFGENWFTYKNLYSRFIKELNDGSRIVEVGCWKGKSIAYLAVEVINSGKDIKIDAVDTWLGSDEHEHVNDPHVKSNTLYELFVSNITPVSKVINPTRMSSVEAANNYDDESLDVVFIDACHSYECVKEDIIAWLPKVKIGGYISGHDYSWGDGVKRAVDEAFESIEETEGCWVHKKGEPNG